MIKNNNMINNTNLYLNINTNNLFITQYMYFSLTHTKNTSYNFPQTKKIKFILNKRFYTTFKQDSHNKINRSQLFNTVLIDLHKILNDDNIHINDETQRKIERFVFNQFLD